MNKTIYLLVLFIFSMSIRNYIYCQNKAEVKIIAGVPSLFINESLYPPFAYMSYLGEKEYYKEIAASGVHLYCFPAFLGDRGINTNSGIGTFRLPIWIGEGKYDFSSIIDDFEKVIESDPEAKVIIRINLDPPRWWEELNSDASAHLEDRTTFRQCFYSEKWRNETGVVLQHCIEWLLNSSYSEYLVGIHIAAGETEEWFYHTPQYNDQNINRLIAFRKWLKEKYNNNESDLKKAWNNRQISFENAQLGNIVGERDLRWRTKDKEQNIVDTYQFQSEIIVDNIEYFCRTVKEASNRTLLTGAFYGYNYYVTDPARGHGSLYKLLLCSDLDYLSSPNVYNRVIGEDWPPMSAIQSIHMHGKLWLAENDTRTSITTLLKDRAPGVAPSGQYENGVWLGPKEMETSVSFLWKNTGRMLTQGYGGWWFDMWGGWFSDSQLLNVIKKTNEFYRTYSQEVGPEMLPQVCVLVDEQLCFWDASHGSKTEEILNNRYPLAKTGAPYDLFLRTDIENIDFNQYRVIWLMGFLELDEKELDLIQILVKQGITILWTDGSGTHLLNSKTSSYIEEMKFLSDSLLRNILKNAGVHIYIDSGDVFYIGRNWLCIHSVFGGKKRISLPFSANITNPDNNESLQNTIDTIKIDMKPKSTVILRIDPI